MGIEMQILEALVDHPRRERVCGVRLGVARFNALQVELKERAALETGPPPPPPGGRTLWITVDYDSMDSQVLIEDEEGAMENWKKYRKVGVTEMRPWCLGEDMTAVSVSPEEVLEPGGMIARNAANPKDQWYVGKAYFEKNYEEA